MKLRIPLLRKILYKKSESFSTPAVRLMIYREMLSILENLQPETFQNYGLCRLLLKASQKLWSNPTTQVWSGNISGMPELYKYKPFFLSGMYPVYWWKYGDIEKRKRILQRECKRMEKYVKIHITLGPKTELDNDKNNC